MEQVWVTTPNGRHRGAAATTFLDRMLGIWRIGDAELVIIPGSSVHGVGLAEPLEAAGVSADGVITRVAMLRPGRFLRFEGVVAVLETRSGRVTLQPGERIAIGARER